MEIINTVLLPNGHRFLFHIQEHIVCFYNYDQKWGNLTMNNASPQGAKETYHLQFMALQFSKYWRAQRRPPTQIVLVNPNELIEMIELGKPGEPAVSHSLAVLLKLGVLGCAGREQDHVNLEDDAKTQGTAASTRSGIIGLTIGELSGLDFNTTMSSSGEITVGDGNGKENEKFNNVLLGEIKTQTVGGMVVKSHDVCKNIKKGDLPPLSPLKANGQPMFLAWHTKGICNPDCPRTAYHGAMYLVED